MDNDLLWLLGFVIQVLALLLLALDFHRSKAWAHDPALSLGEQWRMALRDRGYQALVLLMISTFIVFVLWQAASK